MLFAVYKLMPRSMKIFIFFLALLYLSFRPLKGHSTTDFSHHEAVSSYSRMLMIEHDSIDPSMQDTTNGSVFVTLTIADFNADQFTASQALQSAICTAVSRTLNIPTAYIEQLIILPVPRSEDLLPSESEVTIKMILLTSYSNIDLESTLQDSVQSGALLQLFIASAQEEGYTSSMAHVLIVEVTSNTLAPSTEPSEAASEFLSVLPSVASTVAPSSLQMPTAAVTPMISPTLIPTDSYRLTTSVTLTISGLSYHNFGSSSILSSALQEAVAGLLKVSLSHVTPPVAIPASSSSSQVVVTFQASSNYDAATTLEMIIDNAANLLVSFCATASEHGYFSRDLSGLSIVGIVTTTTAPTVVPTASPSIASTMKPSATSSANASSLPSVASTVAPSSLQMPTVAVTPTLIPTDSNRLTTTTNVNLTISGLSYHNFESSSILSSALQEAVAGLLEVSLPHVTPPVTIPASSSSSQVVVTFQASSDYDAATTLEMIIDNAANLLVSFYVLASVAGYTGDLSGLGIVSIVTSTLAPSASGKTYFRPTASSVITFSASQQNSSSIHISALALFVSLSDSYLIFIGTIVIFAIIIVFPIRLIIYNLEMLKRRSYHQLL